MGIRKDLSRKKKEVFFVRSAGDVAWAVCTSRSNCED